MSLILVVEPESRYVERIHDALGADGWKVQAVPGHAEALAAVASQSPDLILVSAGAPGAERVVSAFSRRVGGPGVLVLLPEGEVGADGGFDGEERLGKPFTAQELRLAVKRTLTARREAPPAPALAPVAEGSKLTSHEIFGDLLAEVEDEVGGTLRDRQPPPTQVMPPADEAVPGAAAPAAAARAAAPGDDLQRKLEETLSGVLPRLGVPPAAAAPRKPERKEEDVDALISRTLTGMNLEKELGRGKTAASKPAAASAPAAVAAAAPSAAAVATPPAAAAATAGAGASPATPAPAQPEPPAPEAAPPPPAAAAPSLLTQPSSSSSPPAPPPAPAAAEPPRLDSSPSGRHKFDLTDLEELTKTRRPTTAVKAAPGTGAAAPAAAGPRPVPPPPPQPGAAASSKPAALDPAATVRIPVVRPEEPQQGERFGQYTLLERIAVGGMAELYKARMSGVEGFQKTVAIKRILPHLTDNAEFVEMFIDEAKLAAQLNHPNIAHIYDLGKIGHDYYIAMEYVEGKDLRAVLNLARKRRSPLPLGLALLIGARLASALDYAHRKRDFDGHELGLVHRDVSPQNILLTDEGDIKLVDFGIAKAVSKASQTQMGALKGKLQYMSPEQAWGRAVDPRSDIFSLGAVLFELLTGERLFAGDNEMTVLETVREGKVRAPREVNPAVPAAVNAIVVHALALEPGERFQTAGELQQRLEAELYALRPTPGHSDLAAYLQKLLEAEPPAAERAAAGAAATAASPSGAGTPTPATKTPPPARAGEVPAVVPLPGAAPGHVPAVLEERGGRGRTLLIAAIVAVAIVGALVTFLVLRSRGAAGAAAPGAAQAARTAPVKPGPAAAAPQAAGPAAAPASSGVNVDQIVNQELARKEEALRQKAEEDKKRIQRELEAAKAAAAAKAQAAAEERQAAVVEPAVLAPPQTAAPEPAPEPAVQRAEPARQEPAPAEPAPHAPAAPQTRAGDLVRLGPGVTPPQLVSYDKPRYPPLAQQLRVEGVVVISLLVDENGHVQEARVAEPIRQKVGINEAALAAARTARYRPATKDGVPVKVWTRLRIPFKL